MRTTVKIDDDVLLAARQLAASKGQSVGQAISDLARASLTRAAVSEYRNGVKLLPARRPEALGSTRLQRSMLVSRRYRVTGRRDRAAVRRFPGRPLRGARAWTAPSGAIVAAQAR